MPRPYKSSESPAIDDDDLYRSSPLPLRTRAAPVQPLMSHSPSSVSSDKENRPARPNNDKSSSRTPMAPPRVPSPSSKRKRLVERGREETPLDRVRRRRTVEAEEQEMYDPDQDVHERRELRKGMRELGKTLEANKSDYQSKLTSKGLRDTLIAANELVGQVRQTSDATIDSRILTNAADMTLARAVALVSGESALCVDVDDFVAKCATFMRSAVGATGADEIAPSATQRRPRRENNDDEDEEEDDGGHMNWAHLGKYACLKHNSRPPVPGFLLGPLSLEKKAKKVVVRKAAFKHTDLEETRPEVVRQEEIKRDENSNLNNLCKQIHSRCDWVFKTYMEIIRKEVEARGGVTDEEGQQLLDQYGLSEDGGVALFKFVINPYSFGQTVENIFYLSFLIRDGHVGILDDVRGLPYISKLSILR